jgi:hypothetical protein
VWSRVGSLTSAQPPAQVERVSGIATFVWIGDDPSTKTPRVTLQKESSPGVFFNLVRESQRLVEDGEIVLSYTPDPLQRSGPQTHYWVAEWQAVPFIGLPSYDSVDTRGGMMLGKYRFHVEGDGWTLDSTPFEVVHGGLVATATRGTTSITVNVRWHAPKGWRLMDMSLSSNQPVPVRNQFVRVEQRSDTNSLLITNATSDGNGVVTVPNQPAATKLIVTDQFDNTYTVTL